MKLNYFALRGKGESIRITLAAAKQEWEGDEGVDYATMKESSGTKDFPFGQVPTLEDGGYVYSQTDAIMRYLGRKFDMYGSTIEESTKIDMILQGVEDLRMKYIKLIYESELKEEAKEEYANLHLGKEGVQKRNGGAHFQYLERLLGENNGGAGFVVGSKLSIADIQVFELVDLHLREALFPDKMKELFPLLCGHFERISAIPEIAAYLKGPKRPSAVNAVPRG